MEFTNDCRYAKAVAEYEVAETLKNLSDTNDIAESIYSSLMNNFGSSIRELAFDYGVEVPEIMGAVFSDSFNF